MRSAVHPPLQKPKGGRGESRIIRARGRASAAKHWLAAGSAAAFVAALGFAWHHAPGKHASTGSQTASQNTTSNDSAASSSTDDGSEFDLQGGTIARGGSSSGATTTTS
jgi:hypothetical protein